MLCCWGHTDTAASGNWCFMPSFIHGNDNRVWEIAAAVSFPPFLEGPYLWLQGESLTACRFVQPLTHGRCNSSQIFGVGSCAVCFVFCLAHSGCLNPLRWVAWRRLPSPMSLPHVSYELELGNSPVMSQLGVIAGQACLFPFSQRSFVLSLVHCPKFVITCMLSVFIVI